MVKDESGRRGEAEAEGAEELAQGDGEGGGVEDENGRGVEEAGRGLKDLLGRKETERGIGHQQAAEMGGGQGVVLDQANRNFAPGVVACVFHCALFTGCPAVAIWESRAAASGDEKQARAAVYPNLAHRGGEVKAEDIEKAK